jgi:putative DNA primase/helicase
MCPESQIQTAELAQHHGALQSQESPSLAGLAQHIQEESERLLTGHDDASLMQHKVLNTLLPYIEPVNFRLEAGLESDKEPLKQKHYLVTIVRKVRTLAQQHGYGLRQRDQSIYVFNGAFWERLSKDELSLFLREAAERMGVKPCDARYHLFKDNLLLQFLSDGYQAPPERRTDEVKLNLQNGTLVITSEGQRLKPFDDADFLTYQLPYAYDPTTQAPRFHAFLARVQPDLECQRVLAEFIAYLFVSTGTLKLEKALLLYGSGANGKSVFFEIISALLGEENTCNYSLQSLTDGRAYYRANLADKLVNYVSEINGKFDTNAFKQLVSGEPIEARLPYGQPLVMKEYAKFIGNCNELPTDVEQTDAYFRRFILVPFAVTIPEGERDPQLSATITATELPGILNWVLDGLYRLLAQRGFSPCEASRRQVEEFQKQSDSVRLFLDEEGYQPDPERWLTHQELFSRYKSYCMENLSPPVAGKKFRKRMERAGFAYFRKSAGFAIRAARIASMSNN